MKLSEDGFYGERTIVYNHTAHNPRVAGKITRKNNKDNVSLKLYFYSTNHNHQDARIVVKLEQLISSYLTLHGYDFRQASKNRIGNFTKRVNQ